LIMLRPRRFICSAVLAFGAIGFGTFSVSAQSLKPPLDRNVIATVDRLYPGFTEILETRDAPLLTALGRVLVANPSGDVLEVLLWMLQYCPSWVGDGETAVQLETVAHAVGRLPVAPVSRALLRGNADQRLSAAILLSGSADLIVFVERQQFERALIAALTDPDLRVREWVAGPLRELETPAASAALMRAVANRDVSEMLYWRATGQSRPFAVPQLSASMFSPTAVAVNAAALAELGALLATGPPELRSSIAEVLHRVMGLRDLPAASVDEIIRALMPHRRDPRPDVRLNALTILASAIKRRGSPFADASEIARELGDLVRGGDLTSSDLSNAIYALGHLSDRATLRLLEQLARSTDFNQRIRELAASTYIALSMPTDTAAERRRLLWEQPDTALEARVRNEGRRALPLAWQALKTGSQREQRAAAALLGWYRDLGSIRPILTALDTSSGAVTREQLLFDLNMILLTEGMPATPEERNGLGTQHLLWVYEQLVNSPTYVSFRDASLASKQWAIFPDHITFPLSVTLTTQITGGPGAQPAKTASVMAATSASAEEFLRSVNNDRLGIAFHAITIGEGVARVASTLYFPGGRLRNQVWISLYRYDAGQWTPINVPSHRVGANFLNEFNLAPGLNRNYGGDHPLKVIRLERTMERIRVDLRARSLLEQENEENPAATARLDGSYLALLEKYRHSNSASVRYTAEFEWGRLTGQPDIDLWIDVLAKQSGSPLQTMAQEVITGYAINEIKLNGHQLAGSERDELISAAVSPNAIDSRFLPSRLPLRENIRAVEASTTFAVVDTVFGSGPLGQSGYSMLFERREDRWVFLFVTKSWIS
jgi:hypothetical protein